ncbi:MAG: hypothetical protein JWP25_7579 [Bradyrhizobium sp.]|nr:hypothetical protein [Bradyrhizobium sp.]
MAQSRVMSLVEVVTGSVIAFAVSIWANYAVLPLFGFQVKFTQSFAITLIFTLISIARSYLVRRFFEVHVKSFATWCQSIYDTNRRCWERSNTAQSLPRAMRQPKV